MTRSQTWLTVIVLYLDCFANACGTRGATSSGSVKAQAGIFFGGQIQNRAEWPLVLDQTRQTQGFRVDFGQVLKEPAHVTWDIVRPTLRQKRHGDPATSSFDATVPPGTDRFDQAIPFTDSDRPGEWKLHVFVNGVSALDRSITIVSKPANNLDD